MGTYTRRAEDEDARAGERSGGNRRFLTRRHRFFLSLLH
jgi:hypothetical protein